MAEQIRALHLRASGSALGAAVDRWLVRSGTRIEVCNDPFEGVAHLFNDSGCVPHLVMIDSSCLTQPDRALIGYIRETWPGSPVVVYAAEPPTWLDPRDRFCVAVGSAHLERNYLAASPASVLERISVRSGDEAPVHSDHAEAVMPNVSPLRVAEVVEIERIRINPATDPVSADMLARREHDPEELASGGATFTADDLAVILGARRRPPRP